MNPPDITIRPETRSDHEAIHALIVEVFRETYGTGEEEAGIVDQMRQETALGPYVSLVATRHDALVGHVFFSPVTLAEFRNVPVCTLGPVGVRRPWQRQGIGSQLIRNGLEQCKKHGYQAVFTTGSLEYYPRFGFAPISTTRLFTIFRTEHDMVLELKPGLLERVSGLVEYPKPWLASL